MRFPVTHALPDGFEPTEDETALIKAVSEGRAWTGSKGKPTPDQLADATFVEKMPVIRAEVIRALCLGYRLNDAPVDPKGIDINGARIDGELDLSFAPVPVRLGLFYCHIAECPNLLQAHFPLLNLSGSRLEQGLAADRLKLDGTLFCRNGFHATGEVRLLGAAIGGNADFESATLSNAGRVALSADGIRVAGDLFCRNGFHATGEVRLLGAKIGGDADFEGAALSNADKEALSADGIKITGSLFCRDGFEITGGADLTTARIEKWFEWTPEEWSGLLRLSHASAGQWKDNWAEDRWAAKGEPQIDLKTFTYDALATTNSRNDAASRIAWIRKSLGEDEFAPGPYETLARALRADGDDGGANDVAYAKQVDRAKHRARPDVTPDWRRRLWRRLVDGVFNLTAGHGYKPWRGMIGLGIMLALGFGVFSFAAPMHENVFATGVIKPATPIIYVKDLTRCRINPVNWNDACPETLDIKRDETLSFHNYYYVLPIEYTPFSPLWYALDTLIPLVDLGQESAWSPSPINSSIFEDFWGWFVLIYLYVHIIAGWLLTTLTVVALSGIIKKD